MEKKKLVPKRRFRGYDSKWNIQKLGNISELTSSKRIYSSDYVEKGIPFFRGTEITKLGKTSVLDNVYYISYDYYNELKRRYGVPNIGDILITAVGTLGNVNLIINNYKFYFKDGNLIWIKGIKLNSRFLSIYLGNGKGKQRTLESAAGSNQNALTMDKMKDILVIYPLKEEQQKIGEFFKVLDERIANQEQKITKVKALKSAYLTEMFPQEGETVPKRRFKEFKNSPHWKRSSMKEVVDVYDGTHQTPKYTDRGVMFLSVENIQTLKSNKYISYEDFERDFKTFPQMGDVLMTRIGNIGTANIVESDENKAYYVTLALLKKRGLDPYFLKESIHSAPVKRELWHRTLHIAFPKKINMDEIGKVKINYPCILEQQKIGAFFKNLDDQITTEEKKLEKLKKMKEAYLEEMFV